MTSPTGVVLLFALLVGQPPDDPDKELKAARLTHMKQAAKGYDLALSSDPAKKMTLTEEPLLRFDDQVTGVVDGTVFVWTFEDRPAAAVSVWIRKTGHEFHEFQSLSTAALTAQAQGEEKWTPAKGGIERSPAALPQPPAATAVARLNQMRAFAREYTASVATSEKDRQELRLLTQPVHRYGRADGEVVDGAMFAYCKGTNPEVLLLVEAVKNGGTTSWSHAFARMTSRQCEVRQADKVVWNVPRQPGGTVTDSYFNVVQRYSGPMGGTPKDK